MARRYCTLPDKCEGTSCKRRDAKGCPFEYVETDYPDKHRYAGSDWPPPSR
jgi:hypothetical protein